MIDLLAVAVIARPKFRRSMRNIALLLVYLPLCLGQSPTVDTGTYSVKAFGAKGDGVTDDTAAIQGAIDACESRVNPNWPAWSAGQVSFPAGRYMVSSQLTAKTCSWLGIGDPGTGVQLMWNGPGSGLFVRKPTAYSGAGAMFFSIQNMAFLAGGHQPESFLEIDDRVDEFTKLDRVWFNGSTGDAVKLTGGWANLHWHRLRFDGIGGFAINATVAPTQNGASFLVDDFTYDNNPAPSAPGVFLFDNSTAGSAFAGVVRISNARIETNVPWAGNKAVVTIKSTAGMNSPVAISLSNIDYQDVNNMTGDCLLYNDFAQDDADYPLLLQNVRLEGMDALFCATGKAYAYGLSVPLTGYKHISHLLLSDSAVSTTFFGDPVTFVGYDPTRVVIQTRMKSDSLPRYNVTAEGTESWYAPAQYSQLGSPSAFTQRPCIDCAVRSAADNTCVSGGSGAMAFWINGAWKCIQ